MSITKLDTPTITDDYSSGMMDPVAVSDSLMPRNAVRKSINAVFDIPRGSIVGRPGSTQLASVGTACLGLHNFRDAGGGNNHRLLATDNGGVTYYLNGSNFSSTLSGDTAGLQTRFVTFLDRVARINGTDGAKSWDGDTGTAWLSTGGPLDVNHWPSNTRFANVFNSKLYTAGSVTAPDTLYYSSIPSAGAISWVSGAGSLQVNPNDGSNGITGLITTGTVELIFKRNTLYRWDGSSTFANQVISVGCPRQEAMANHDSGFVYFFGLGKASVGAYRTSGGYPQKLSKNIERWFKAISPSYYDSVAAFCDDDHFYISVGTVTVDGSTYTNAWFVYTISMQVWHIESRATSFTVFTSYIDTTSALTTVGGNTAGSVETINSGTTDNGTPISADVELGRLPISTRARTKMLSTLTAYATYWKGINVFLRADNGEYKSLGQMKSAEQNFKSFTVRGKRIYPRITVINSHDAWQFDGFEINDVMDEGYDQ